MTLLCFSNYRWDADLPRPKHILTQFTKQYRVFFIEEPLYHEKNDCYSIRPTEENVWVVTPYLKKDGEHKIGRQKKIIDHLIYTQNVGEFITWYYAPDSLPYSRYFNSKLTIYDCIENVSAEMKELEKELFRRADIVFTDSDSLFEKKKQLHHNIYSIPTDKRNFALNTIKDITVCKMNDLIEQTLIDLKAIKRIPLSGTAYAVLSA